MPKQPTQAKKKKSKASKAEPLPWVPMLDHIRLKEKQTGSMVFAINDLEQELASGKRPWMRREISTGASERGAASFWLDHLIDISTGAVAIYRRRERELRRSDFAPEPRRWGFYANRHDQRVDGHVYFVGADPAAPSSPVRKGGAGGRPPSFASKQIGELQREQRKYEKAHPNEPKKDVEQHLQNWAKDKGITAGIGTIRKHMKTATNKN